MEELIKGWNPISKELNVDVKTAIRYFKLKNLPVVYDPAGHPVTTKERLYKWMTGN